MLRWRQEVTSPKTIATLALLVPNWSLGKPAAFDLSVTSPLNSNILLEAGFGAGQAARATEQRKHEENDAKCKERLHPHGG